VFINRIRVELIELQRHNFIGWTAEVDPVNHSISKFQFDVVIGADGKRNTLKGIYLAIFRAG